jgi:hypothetical protein
MIYDNNREILDENRKSLPAYISESIHNLSDENPAVRKSAVLYLNACIWDDLDITSALPALEESLHDADVEIRKHAAVTLEEYALLMYKVDISSVWTPIAYIASRQTPVRRHAHSKPTYVSECLSAIQSGTDKPQELASVSPGTGIGASVYRSVTIVVSLYYAYFAKQMERLRNKADIILHYGIRNKLERPLLLTVLLMVIFSFVISLKEVSVSSIENVVTREHGPPAETFMNHNMQKAESPGVTIPEDSLSSEADYTGIIKPDYLSNVKGLQRRFIATESSVFQVLKEAGDGNAGFVSWFNALTDIQKRGFILFIRSKSLTQLLGNKISFSRNHWESGGSAKISRLTKTYLEEYDLLKTAKVYGPVYRLAEIQRDIFLNENRWLITYLEDNYTDFYEGLFYFFSEHGFAFREVYERSQQFSRHETDIKKASRAVIAYRGRNIRISPKRYVSNGQIREIVAGAFFAESFYGVPADFITLISAYETNFSMEFWRGGQGTTQQTIRAANTVLQSEYWIRKLNEAAGVTIRMQLVPISALDNIFLCVAEAAKTIAIKAAEIQIKTNDISSHKKVQYAGKPLSAAYVTAYKYNGSESNAVNYAQEFQRFYEKRSHWLQSFPQKEYKLLSYNK